ncbi:MAG: glycolate oxidase subunit GlcF [Rhodospirillaceae bacterium]|jgi:glycolate oxidase iron-sulfur subunit|nr:glycolate oxidase subunit GlcF [Rhodospirillaceae bacterium]
MQTRFTQAQLADADIADSNDILRACVHCGFCTATCPTYRLLGDELDGPRGRIYLIKEMLEQDRPPSATDVRHVDRCLSCLSCMTTCPSGVHYMHLVDHARRHMEGTHRRPLKDRILRQMLGCLLPDPRHMRTALAVGRLVRPLAWLLPGVLARLVSLAPAGKVDKVVTPSSSQQRFPAMGEKRYRVALLAGCVQQPIAPQINRATISLLTRLGCEVIVPGESGCCGAVNQHLGQETRARDAALANIKAWHELADDGGLDALIVNASGCGTMVKDYGYLFRDDPDVVDEAEMISKLARDVSEFLHEIGLGDIAAPQTLRIAYQSACSLQHGQKIHREPLALLTACGFDMVEPADGHLCCGSAGTYNILQPVIADQLRDEKIAALSAVTPQAIATGNVGCMVQLQQAAPCPVVHTVELLDWAMGGSRPKALAETMR